MTPNEQQISSITSTEDGALQLAAAAIIIPPFPFTLPIIHSAEKGSLGTEPTQTPKITSPGSHAERPPIDPKTIYTIGDVNASLDFGGYKTNTAPTIIPIHNIISVKTNCFASRPGCRTMNTDSHNLVESTIIWDSHGLGEEGSWSSPPTVIEIVGIKRNLGKSGCGPKNTPQSEMGVEWEADTLERNRPAYYHH
jgi:hypothetical protein